MTSKDMRQAPRLGHTTIVRHRGKILSVINNAKCVQALIAEAEGVKGQGGAQPLMPFFGATLMACRS